MDDEYKSDRKSFVEMLEDSRNALRVVNCKTLFITKFHRLPTTVISLQVNPNREHSGEGFREAREVNGVIDEEMHELDKCWGSLATPPSATARPWGLWRMLAGGKDTKKKKCGKPIGSIRPFSTWGDGRKQSAGRRHAMAGVRL